MAQLWHSTPTWVPFILPDSLAADKDSYIHYPMQMFFCRYGFQKPANYPTSPRKTPLLKPRKPLTPTPTPTSSQTRQNGLQNSMKELLRIGGISENINQPKEQANTKTKSGKSRNGKNGRKKTRKLRVKAKPKKQQSDDNKDTQECVCPNDNQHVNRILLLLSLAPCMQASCIRDFLL